MLITVNTNNKILSVGNFSCTCAIGKNGVVEYENGQEGDGKTPLGVYDLRFGLYRADRVKLPKTSLDFWPLQTDDGWCDAPNDPAYNRFVRLPYNASCERLWRNSNVYDIIIVLGHNDSPPIANMGSAIFLHLAREKHKQDYNPTQGCIAIAKNDMLKLLPMLDFDNKIEIL